MALHERTYWSMAGALLVLASFAPRVVVRVRPVQAQTAKQPSNNEPVIATSTSTLPSSLAGTECPPLTIPDHGVCVHLPNDEQWSEDPVGSPEGVSQTAGHFERDGRWRVYEQIPRRPDRPEDYDLYEYPIPPGLPNSHSVVSGYDLHLPDALQRRGRGLKAIGHGAVDLPQKRGTPVKLVHLEHQVSDAEILYVGTLMGFSVVTKHTLREGGRERDYVLIFGHLDGAAPGLVRGLKVRAGEVIGFVGDTGSPGIVHLHLEARRVRDGIDGSTILAHQILSSSITIVCDPRNVLSLKK